MLSRARVVPEREPRTGHPATSGGLEDCADQQAVGPQEPWQHAKMISQRNKAESYVKARALLKEQQRNKATAAGFLAMLTGIFAAWAVTLLPVDEAVMNALTLSFGLLILLGFCVLFIVDYDFDAIPAWFPRVSRHACAGLFVFPALMVVQQLCVEPYELWFVSWFGVMCTLPAAIWIALHLRELIALSNPQLWLPTEVVCIWQCSQMAGHAVHHGSMACGLVAGDSAVRFGWSRSAFGLVAGVSLLCSLTVGWLLTARNSRFTGRCLACDGRRFGLSSPTIRMMISVGLMNTTLQTLFRAKFIFPGDGAAGAAAGGTAVAASTADVRTEAIATIAFTLVPFIVCFRWRAPLSGMLGRFFERNQRLEDGAFIASLLVGERLQVGDEYWVPSRLDLEDGSAGASVQERSKWFRGIVASIENHLFVVLLPATLALPPTVERRTVVHATVNMSAEALFRCACASLYQVRADEVTQAILTNPGTHIHVGSLVSPILRKQCRPGETDWFVLHSWHDDPFNRLRALTRCAQQFEDWQGRQPSLWLDCLCVEAAYQEESLLCLPIYMQACRGVLVLCGPTFFERLWCVWELYTAFAFSDGSPSLVIAIVQHPGGSSAAPEGQQGSVERVGAELRARLSGFMLANAHCANPNEEKRLRNAISAAPGGTAAFQDTIRGISSKLVGRADARGGRVVGDFELIQQTAAASAPTWSEG